MIRIITYLFVAWSTVLFPIWIAYGAPTTGGGGLFAALFLLGAAVLSTWHSGKKWVKAYRGG